MSEFVKYHALGNDYLVVDPHQVECVPRGELARRLCDRHRGVGADGVLFGPTSTVEPGRPVELSVFNSDGSVCEKSGNGIRIFALYLAEHYLTEAEFAVRTIAGDSQVEICDFDAGIVAIDMGCASFDAAVLPVLGLTGPALNWSLDVGGRSVPVSSVHNGNPHTVVAVDELSREIAYELGPAIAGHPRFPERTNVSFMCVVDRGLVEIEIWERGAGYTLASGSSACAAATVARALGLVDDAVTVRMPGGELEIVFDAAGAARMTGVVEKVASGDLSASLRGWLAGPARTVAAAAGKVGVA